MQQQSMQYHIDAIRNILSLKPKTTKHTRRHLVHLDPCESIKRNITNKKQISSSVSNQTYLTGALIMCTFIINMIISTSTHTNPIKILYIPICIYLLWVSYSFIHAISLRQKIKLFIFIMPTTMLLSEAIEIETPKTLDASIIYISLMTITTCINISNIIQLFIKENNSEDRENSIFINESMFISYKNKTTTTEELLANEYIQHMIHQLGDIIVVGHKSPVHAILTKRYEKLPHNRSILEQHLYHLSCQIPLIYLTPDGNYIPKTPTTAA